MMVQQPLAVVDHTVDYVTGKDWVQGVHPRVRELAPPPLEDADSKLVRRLLVPRNLADLQFLSLLREESLRVDLLPHRTPLPHVHVHVLTNGIAFYPPLPEKRWLLSRWLPPRRFWFSMFQVIVYFPQGVSLLSCDYAWRWAQDNLTEHSRSPFRALEVSCPRRPQSILTLPVWPSERARGPRDTIVHCLHVALLMMLVVACVAQMVLLLVCLVMLLLQVRRARLGGL